MPRGICRVNINTFHDGVRLSPGDLVDVDLVEWAADIEQNNLTIVEAPPELEPEPEPEEQSAR